MEVNLKYTCVWLVLFRVCTAACPPNCNYDNRELTELPGDIPHDALSISVNYNQIERFPEDAFEPFFQLEELSMQGNPIQRLPNLLPVADTLLILTIKECPMFAELNETIFNELTALKSLVVSNTLIASVPNLPGPGNSLEVIRAANCKLTRFPDVSQYRFLRKLNINKNPMNSVQDSDVDNLEQLDMLLMCKVPLHTLPYNPKSLHTLSAIDISESNVSTVPVTCPTQDLVLEAQGAPVSLCRCENVWLKAMDRQRGEAQLDDMTCRGATTTEEIAKKACQRTGSMYEFIVARKHAGFLCEFPIHSHVTGFSHLGCTMLCLRTPGCLSFNYLATGERTGDCVIVAATDASLDVTTTPQASSPLWDYYTLRQKEEIEDERWIEM